MSKCDSQQLKVTRLLEHSRRPGTSLRRLFCRGPCANSCARSVHSGPGIAPTGRQALGKCSMLSPKLHNMVSYVGAAVAFAVAWSHHHRGVSAIPLVAPTCIGLILWMVSRANGRPTI